MAIGTTAALLTSALVGAGTSLASAKVSSNAAKKASQVQQQSATQALGMARDAYNTQMGLQMPYLNAGNSAINTLGRLMAPPGGSLFAAPQVPQVQIPGVQMPGYGQPQMPSATQMRMVGAGATPMAQAQRSPFMIG